MEGEVEKRSGMGDAQGIMQRMAERHQDRK